MSKITVNEKNYCLDDNTIDMEYRSHINGMNCLSPNNWVSGTATDEEGNEYKLWYYVEDDFEFDKIDYDNPDDITDEYNHLVYSKDDAKNED